MFSPFVCGNFSNREDDDMDELLGQCTTPRTSRKSGHRDNKNPYANRGLDKFSALLAELEDKKQKIYTQKGSHDISFVRFIYSNSNDWKPIVVKAKDRKQENKNRVQDNVKDKQMIQNSEAQDKQTIEASIVANEVRQQQKEELSQRPKEKSNSWSLKLKNLRHPCCYLVVMMVLILLFLAMHGRSFAVLCTSLGWYLVPMIKEKGTSSSEKTKKKDYVRRLSEKNMVNDGSSSPKCPGSSSPKSVLSGPAEKPTGVHAHRNSW